MTDLLSLVGARGAAMVLSFVSVMITTRLLSPDVYAVLAYVLVVAFLVFNVSSAWTSAAVFRYGREELEDTGRMAGTTWARFAMTAPLVVVAAPVLLVVFALGVLPDAFTIGFLGAAFAVGIAMVLNEHFIYMTEAAGRIKLSAIAQITQKALVVAALAALLFIGTTNSPAVVIAISFAGAALLAIWLGAKVWRLAVWPPVLDRRLFRRILVFSVPLIPVVASHWLIRSFDLFAIGALLTSADVGVYAIAYQAFILGSGFATAVGPVFSPLLVSLQVARRDDMVARYFDRAVPLLAFFAAIALGLGAPLAAIAVPVVFGASFAAAASPLVLLLAALWLSVVAHLLGPIILLHERARTFMWSALAAAVVNVVGDLALIPVLGIEGAALATTAAFLVFTVWYLVVARRLVGSEHRYNWGVAVPLVAGVVPAALAPPGIAIAIAVPAVLGSALFLLRRTDLLSDADLTILAQVDVPGPARAIVHRLARLGGSTGVPGPHLG